MSNEPEKKVILAMLVEQDKKMLKLVKAKKVPKDDSADFIDWMSQQSKLGYLSIEALIVGVETRISKYESI